MDIGKDLQRAYDDGYEQGKQDAVRWTPVTERLPKEVGWYLVVVLAPFKQVRMYEFYPVHNNYGNDLWRNNDGDHVSNWFVTHWMPLPEPPKEET